MSHLLWVHLHRILVHRSSVGAAVNLPSAPPHNKITLGGSELHHLSYKCCLYRDVRRPEASDTTLTTNRKQAKTELLTLRHRGRHTQRKFLELPQYLCRTCIVMMQSCTHGWHLMPTSRTAKTELLTLRHRGRHTQTHIYIYIYICVLYIYISW